MKNELNQLIQAAIQKYATQKGFEIEVPMDCGLVLSKDPSHGDFASNVAFKISKIAKDRPKTVADELATCIQDENSKMKKGSVVDRLEVAGNGFINFFLTKNSLSKILFEVQEKDFDYGKSKFGAAKKVLLEFVSANPTGPLTIAHGRQAAIGDSLARILKATAHTVKREYYLNDAGRQMNLLGESLFARYSEKLGKPCPFPEEGYKGDYIYDIAESLVKDQKDALLKETKEAALEFCRAYACKRMMKSIQDDLATFRVTFEDYFSEQTLHANKAIDETFEVLKKRGHLYESEGALWFKSIPFGDDKDRVVKKSSGEFTYLAPDIAYHRSKFDRGFNCLINLWGPDHHGYIARLKAACQALGHDPKEIEILIVQLTTLYRKGEVVRMSTRAGEFVTLKELMDEVGVDATRFFFVMRRIETHLDFDLDLAKEKSQENPVYYLQYAHARIASLIKFSERKITTDVVLERLDSSEEAVLIKAISDYPEVLIRASEGLEPYRLVDYLRDLAMAFHKFYANQRVVTEDEELTQARLLLADCARIVLRNGLELLGISQPESM